jgi:small basic protein (TIGR04137 family)
MSIHRSLVSKNRLVRRRNVLTRDERVKQLTDKGKMEEEDSVYGLPKVKVRKLRKRVKAKKKKEEAVAGAETEEKAQEKKE